MAAREITAAAIAAEGFIAQADNGAVGSFSAAPAFAPEQVPIAGDVGPPAGKGQAPGLFQDQAVGRKGGYFLVGPEHDFMVEAAPESPGKGMPVSASRVKMTGGPPSFLGRVKMKE